MSTLFSFSSTITLNSPMFFSHRLTVICISLTLFFNSSPLLLLSAIARLFSSTLTFNAATPSANASSLAPFFVSSTLPLRPFTLLFVSSRLALSSFTFFFTSFTANCEVFTTRLSSSFSSSTLFTASSTLFTRVSICTIFSFVSESAVLNASTCPASDSTLSSSGFRRLSNSSSLALILSSMICWFSVIVSYRPSSDSDADSRFVSGVDSFTTPPSGSSSSRSSRSSIATRMLPQSRWIDCTRVDSPVSWLARELVALPDVAPTVFCSSVT